MGLGLLYAREEVPARPGPEQEPGQESPVACIVLRSSVVSVINDLERAVDDGLACVQQLCREPGFVPGAGATEIELAAQLRKLADETDSLDQYAIRKVRSFFFVTQVVLVEREAERERESGLVE